MKHPIFNYSNLSKYLWIEKNEIKFFTVCMPVCVVTLKTGERIKVRSEDLIQQLNSDRCQRAEKQNIRIEELGHWFKAFSPSGNVYRLDPDRDCIECDCKDSQNMSSMLGKGKVTCKHGYKLLQSMGFTDLTDPNYQELVEELYLIAEYENEMDRQAIYGYQDVASWSM